MAELVVPDLQPVTPPTRRSRRAATARRAVMLAAAFGGISPNLLRMAVSLTGDKGELPLSASYWIGLLLFAFLGGAMSLIWGETEIRRAYYLGLGLPSLLQVGVSSASEKRVQDRQQEERPAETPQPAQNGAGFWLFTPPAYAAPQPQRPQGQPSAIERQEVIVSVPSQRTRELALEYTKKRQLSLQLDSIPEDTELLLYEDGYLKSRVVLKKTDENTTLALPLLDSITAFRVRKDNAQSDLVSVPLAPGSTSTFKVDVDKNPWSGLLQALGARNVNQYDVEVERTGGRP